MPRRDSPYGLAYERDRAAMLRRRPRCVYCSRPASEADHVPPVDTHRVSHVHGSGCCRLVPSCGDCARRQGGLIRARKAAVQALPADVDFDPAGGSEVPEPLGFDVLDPVWDVEWLVDLRKVPKEAVWPRLMTMPHPLAVGSLGKEFEAWVRKRTGRRLRWWQRLVARRLLEVDVAGRLVWDVLILTLARQLGKSWLLRELIMWRLHQGERFGGPQLILHTGMNLKVCRRLIELEWKWARLHPDEYRVREVNSQEQLERVEDGSMWVVVSKTATYGDTAALALVDEGWAVKQSLVDDGLDPTLVEGEQSQLILSSTAHRLATALMLTRRQLALASLDAPGDGDLIVEWSAPREVEISDEAARRMASPAWSERRERMIAKKVAAALSGAVSDDPTEPDPVEAIRAQWLNIWPDRLTLDGRGELLFDTGVWDGAELDLEPLGSLVLAVEDWVGQGAAAAAAGVSDDGRVVVGGWCFDRRVEAYEWVRRWAKRVDGCTLLLGVTLRDDLEHRDVPAQVETRSSMDTRSGLSLLRELVADGRVVHDGSGDMRTQMIQARVTPAPGGGLHLVNAGRLDLVRAVAWAAAEAHRTVGLVSLVYGGPLGD